MFWSPADKKGCHHDPSPKKVAAKLHIRSDKALGAPRARISEKSLLLVRVDFIGDYVLFRNFIKALRCDPRYRGYHFTFLGNASYKDLFENLDAKFFDHALWLDPARFNQDFVYRFKTLWMITRRGFEVVISPVYSRNFWVVDHIVHLVRAREKIGSAGDLTNINKRRKKISDAYYTRLVPATQGVIFEFQRNREFFQGLLGKAMAVDRPRIDLAPSKAGFDLFEKYALLFIGGSSPAKKSRLANYIRIGRYLAEVHGLDVVFCGGPDDMADLVAAPIDQEARFINLVGLTTLWELASVMVKAHLLLSNDTMAPHLAAALGLDKIFVVDRGDLYRRCLPYPRRSAGGCA